MMRVPMRKCGSTGGCRGKGDLRLCKLTGEWLRMGRSSRCGWKSPSEVFDQLSSEIPRSLLRECSSNSLDAVLNILHINLLVYHI